MSRAPASVALADRPKIKICGITTPRDAELAAELGADFIGLNFYPPSPRHVDLVQAREIADAVRGRAAHGRSRLVGVFVARPPAEVAEIEEAIGLDLLQFHGDEPEEQIRPLAPRAIKVFRVEGDCDPAPLEAYHRFWGGLIDYRHPRLYGGSGEGWNFASLARIAGLPETARPRRLFIAGGLDPDNVRAAIHAARPYGIDVCSGIERQPGLKDPALLRQLFEEVDDVPQSQPA